MNRKKDIHFFVLAENKCHCSAGNVSKNKMLSRSFRRKVMTSVYEIERAIRQLPKLDLKILRGWFYELEEEMWDQEFEEDV
jgi:hypothetical protein